MRDLYTHYVFPARAGMSPLHDDLVGDHQSFPRTRGDEPWAMPWAPALDVFSPHARG